MSNKEKVLILGGGLKRPHGITLIVETLKNYPEFHKALDSLDVTPVLDYSEINKAIGLIVKNDNAGIRDWIIHLLHKAYKAHIDDLCDRYEGQVVTLTRDYIESMVSQTYPAIEEFKLLYPDPEVPCLETTCTRQNPESLEDLNQSILKLPQKRQS